ncbi:hypothetical protein C0Q70_17871 [Pomacea canaliculata]|uniref:Uncharacterized protein n=1 Tax=Pomacea canaliculata TaxID=400727 RepID=A0A2T7NLM8_POMCA|nr:hypothetical protein C0Q70_17871 [Pomacea canaliculata]
MHVYVGRLSRNSSKLLPDCYAYLLSKKVGGGPSIPSIKHVRCRDISVAGCLGGYTYHPPLVLKYSKD